MADYDYSENKMIRDSAGNLLHDELKWDVYMSQNFEKFGDVLDPSQGYFGRTSKREVLLTKYLEGALRNLNPWISDKAINEVIEKLKERLSTDSLMQINEDKYLMLRDGVEVDFITAQGTTEQRTAQLIDTTNPLNNSFVALKEFEVDGAYHHRRADIVGFVNGVPLLFIECKRNDVDVEDAYNDNYTDYLDTVPHLFYYNTFVMLSNGLQSKVGTIGSPYKFFHEWKRLAESDQGDVAFATMLRGICRKENFIDLFSNFILYDHREERTAKILARNHQYLGVNNAVQAYEQRELTNGKLGIFWHTQGSGKSYSMLFLAQKIRRKFKGSPTIVVLTDREELNKQISETFQCCNLLGKGNKSETYIATSGEDLIDKLQANPPFIFTLIQKFNKQDAKPIYPDYDILIMSDEAHRSQFGIYAENLNHLLPTASKIGFTGTPLMTDDDIQRRTFGDYVSIYDFQRAVDDKATVPLLYQNRGEKLEAIKDKQIDERVMAAIAEADLDEEQQAKLEEQFKQEVHILMAEERLDAIAKDFVQNYSDMWQSGKAMFVCLNKVTCVRMYNLAQKYWQQAIAKLESDIKHCTSDQEAEELQRKLRWMKETEMCVVVSQEQNEIQTFQKWGLDIMPHREKMVKRELDLEFKKADNPFRIAFVCAMWLTGFDVPSLSCMYIDKPLKAHTLMQTIARANRVAEGKENGLIIDYIGVVQALRKALAQYTQTGGNSGEGTGTDSGTDPTIDKDKLQEQITAALTAGRDMLSQYGYNLENLLEATDFAQVQEIENAANALMGHENDKKLFGTICTKLLSYFRLVDREDVTDNQRREKNALVAISHRLLKQRKKTNYVDLMVEINSIMNEYVHVQEGSANNQTLDISRINFDLLQREFERVKHKQLLIKDLQDVVEAKINKMLHTNDSEARAEFYKRYLQIIEEYNKSIDKTNIESIFAELLELSTQLDEEEQRYVREGLQSDEELSIYDLLFKDNLTKQDIKKIKEIAADLLQTVKHRIDEFHGWKDKVETRSQISTLILDYLYSNLPDPGYSEAEVSTYANKVYQYIYYHYPPMAA